MLTSTFQHLTGIGKKTEQDLWSSGVLSWDDFQLQRRSPQMSMFDLEAQDPQLGELSISQRALCEGDADYFAASLPKQEHYRIALAFPTRTLFLDIETTGLSLYYDSITLIGWSFNDEYGLYIKGNDPDRLGVALAQAKVIVTFNGSVFDLPFLRREFPDLKIPMAHVDLRFLGRRVGFIGGQKHVESAIGWQRVGPLAEIEGVTAPLLWYRYRRGDIDALRLLVAYNRADIAGMKKIFDTAIDRLLAMDYLPRNIRALHRFSITGFEILTDIPRDLVPLIRKYQGNSGPLIKLNELAITQHNIVGIDLTGSESRPSGWCHLANGRATTRRISSDTELIEATVRCKPDLVSIDSPLSLPKGRISVDDDDPGRREFGITRECERILKKRGINVYPSLINSMQALTARGIRLAETLRRLGVPVIESYPGAAQDIMNIPRKRADLALLKTGLAEFGISGEFEHQDVSHDELDAITSAAVGLFFISGKFEPLGNEDEEYLIIPDMSTGVNSWGKRRVVGLSGPISSGKTTVGKYLASLGFAYGRYSQILRSMLQDRGIQVTRVSLQQMGEEVNGGRGQRWLGSELIKILPEGNDVVIDGLRHPEDHAFLAEKFGLDFLHISVEAPVVIRRERYSAEGTYEEFDKASAHPVESNIPKVAKLAHAIVSNTGSKDEFLRNISEVINQYFGKEDNVRCRLQ